MFSYAENTNGGITIKGFSTCFSSSDSNFVIPDTIINKPVTEISTNAFYNKNLISVRIPIVW